MIEFPWYVGLSGWIAILLPFVLLLNLISLVMKSREVFLGGWATALANLVAVWSVGGDTIIEWGFYIAMVVLLAFSCITRLVIGNTGKDKEAVDWDAIGSYCAGSVIAFALTLVIYWVCG